VNSSNFIMEKAEKLGRPEKILGRRNIKAIIQR
jgi:hypothetical protein